MHITTVNYQETFNLGNYCSQRIGVEVTLNEGEDAKQALETARLLVHEYHSQTTPEQEMRGTIVRDVGEELDERPLIDQINTCTDIELLGTYKLLVRGDEELNTAFRKKLIELSTLKP